MAGKSSQASVEKIAPRTGLERTIAGIWQEVLGTESVGVHNSFFELGGQSILLVQVHSKVQQALGENLSMVELLRYPTISSLAGYLGQKEKQKPSYQGAQERAEKQKQIRQKRMQQKRGRGRPRLGRHDDQIRGSCLKYGCKPYSQLLIQAVIPPYPHI
jgi:acyl carrier protein